MVASCSKASLPWAELPTEMVDEVVGHLDIFSTAQFTSVCPSWAKAVTTNPTLPFGTPCLLMSLEDDEQAESHPVDDDDEQAKRTTTFGLLELYSPWRETTTFPACIRAMRDRYWVGAKDDWLAIVDESCNAELLNPYSGHRVHLPAITTIPGVELTGGVCGLRRCGTNGYDHVLRRIVVCETPSGSDGYLVIGLFSSGLLAVARGGGEHSWTALKNPREAWSSSFDSYSDAIAHKGKVFAVGTNGYLYAWDLAAGTTCHEPVKLRPPQANHGSYKCPQNLAESADGRRLLLVCTHDWRYKLNINLSGEIERCDEHGHGVHLYELDVDAAAVSESDGDHGWSRVTSLGDCALFLGSNYPFLADVDRGSGDLLLRPNSVCFTMNELLGYLGMDFDLVVLDLDDQEHQRTKLFHSNRYYSFQSPIWFRPRVVSRQRQSI